MSAASPTTLAHQDNRPMQADAELVRRLPKTDLHVHLDGSLRLETLLELAAERAVELPAQTPEGLVETVFKPSYSSLEEYLHGFAYTCAVLQDAAALERAAREFAEDCIADGVLYAELRFAPQLHMHAGLDFDAVMVAVSKGSRPRPRPMPPRLLCRREGLRPSASASSCARSAGSPGASAPGTSSSRMPSGMRLTKRSLPSPASSSPAPPCAVATSSACPLSASTLRAARTATPRAPTPRPSPTPTATS